MSKELSPSDAFIRIEHSSKRYKGRKEDLDTIFTALKDYEMEHTLRIRLENINYELVREKQKNDKELKALEIIKEKQVDVYILLKTKSLDEYNEWYVGIQDDFIPLTQEEYDLLKEILL